MTTKKPILVLLAGIALVGSLMIGRALMLANSEPDSTASTFQSEAVSTDNHPSVETTLPAFRRVDDNYCRGAEPLHGGIGTLVSLGVKTVVDLRSRYDRTDDIMIGAERVGLRYQWLPMSVWDPPTDEQANQFVTLVTDKSQGPFFVFCTDGLHRTGEMSAIYRVVSDGWSVDQALREMDEVGFSPYYYSLRNYVWDYARKYRPSAVPAGARRTWSAS